MSDKDNKNLTDKLKNENILKLLNSADEMRDWFYVYFDIWFPKGHVFPSSNSSPIEAAWRIYELMKTGESKDIPQVAMHSSRDSFKTLIAAAIEVLCMIHFRICVANASSILSQSEKTIEYINSFFRKIKPHLETNGWRKNSDNKRKIEWITDKNEVIYVQVLVMTIRGMNSSHLPMLFIDEADLIQDIRALHESKMIPSTYKQYYPLTCILSTLKFSGGIMQKLLDETKKAGGEIYKWNIIDVTESIPEEVAKKNKPKVVRYITTQLPMSNISEEEYLKLDEEEKNKYERFEAYAGIAEHPMLPVMKNYLADRPQEDKKFLYKPLAAVHNNFKVTPIDMADAQLLCNKPSSSNLVFPRFDPILNTLTIDEAWKRITGEDRKNISYEQLRQFLLSLGAKFIGGADWGYTDYTSLSIIAVMPGGDTWLIDNIIQDKLELDDICKLALELDKKWEVERWYVDQAYPAYIQTLRRKGLKVPEFTKSVSEGISAIQSRIVDSEGTRRFFVLDVPETRFALGAFNSYKWALDGKGEIIEGKPHHDRDGYSDFFDSIRYIFQNLFGTSKKISFTTVLSDPSLLKNKPLPNQSLEEIAKQTNQQLMKEKVGELVPESNRTTEKNKNAKKILWM